jgi:sterol desaturase/sphingolipid hydroxylase (fatty acid hydroxylase superfamily)
MSDYLEPIILALIPGFLLLDFIVQKRRYKKTRHWRLRGALVTVAIFFFTGQVALFWGNLLQGRNLIDGSGLGIVGGAIAGVLVYEVIHYWYHRKAHEWNWLWRAGHQMHHSAESLDTFGAYYLHPFDAAMFTTWGSLVFFPLLGLVPEAGMLGTLFLTFNALFQHANINTPHWLGFVIQRPESHAIHHGRGIHRYNYADLPVIDMIFGTFKNPASVAGLQTGFYKGASSRIIDMLLFRDVSMPKQATAIPPLEFTVEEITEQLTRREAA